MSGEHSFGGTWWTINAAGIAVTSSTSTSTSSGASGY
jgi:hypothetical protein